MNQFKSFTSWIVLLWMAILQRDLAAYEDDFCYAALDVVQIQDMTSSFDPLWPTMAQVTLVN